MREIKLSSLENLIILEEYILKIQKYLQINDL